MEMFEKRRHKKKFLQDMSRKQEINRFSEESPNLLEDMNRTEIIEFCVNSAKLQCPDCNSFSEIGIIYCSCGRILKYPRSPTTSYKKNDGSTSIANLVIEKNSSRGSKHGQSERQIMFFKTKEMLNNARQDKRYFQDGIHSKYQKSLLEQNIGEKEVMLYDRIDLERHEYTATRAERLQNVKHWVLRLNADGSQKPFRQRQTFTDA